MGNQSRMLQSTKGTGSTCDSSETSGYNVFPDQPVADCSDRAPSCDAGRATTAYSLHLTSLAIQGAIPEQDLGLPVPVREHVREHCLHSYHLVFSFLVRPCAAITAAKVIRTSTARLSRRGLASIARFASATLAAHSPDNHSRDQ